MFEDAQVIFFNTDTTRCQTSKWNWDKYGFFNKETGGIYNSRK